MERIGHVCGWGLGAFVFSLVVAPLVHERRRRRRLGEVTTTGRTVEVLKVEQEVGRFTLRRSRFTAGGGAGGHNGATATPR
jgi:hypothetical protein